MDLAQRLEVEVHPGLELISPFSGSPNSLDPESSSRQSRVLQSKLRGFDPKLSGILEFLQWIELSLLFLMSSPLVELDFCQMR